MYFEAQGLKLRTSITVLAGNIVSVDPPKEMLTNVPFPTKGYSFLVKIRFVYQDFCNRGLDQTKMCFKRLKIKEFFWIEF